MDQLRFAVGEVGRREKVHRRRESAGRKEAPKGNSVGIKLAHLHLYRVVHPYENHDRAMPSHSLGHILFNANTLFMVIQTLKATTSQT